MLEVPKKILVLILIITLIVFFNGEHIGFILKTIAPGKSFVEARMSELNNILYLKTTLLFASVCFLLIKSDCFTYLLKSIVWFFRNLNKYWLSVPQSERNLALLLFSTTALFRIFWVFELPITHDEASTYVNFTGRGLLYAMGYYTAPNNHILNSVLAVFTCKLPIQTTIALRIPSFLAGMASVVALWVFLRRNTSSASIALLISGVFAMTYFITDYGVMARGYSFILLFFTISYYVLLKWLEAENDNVYEPKVIFGMPHVFFPDSL